MPNEAFCRILFFFKNRYQYLKEFSSKPSKKNLLQTITWEFIGQICALNHLSH